MRGGPLLYINKGGGGQKYYCSTRNLRGSAACSNGKGVPMERLDEAVNARLYDMLNRDFDQVVNLCMEQGEV